MRCASPAHDTVNGGENVDAPIIIGTIQHSIRYTYAAIRSKVNGHTASKHGGECKVDKAAVLWCVAPYTYSSHAAL